MALQYSTKILFKNEESWPENRTAGERVSWQQASQYQDVAEGTQTAQPKIP